MPSRERLPVDGRAGPGAGASTHGGAVSFHAATPADADALASLRVAAMHESLERVGRFDEARARARLLDAFDAQLTTVIHVDGALAGFFVVRPSPDGLLLDHLYIHPRHQGRGLGALVLGHLFALADARQVTVRVGALRESDSNRFYLRHGFVPAGTSAFDNHYLRVPAKAGG